MVHHPSYLPVDTNLNNGDVVYFGAFLLIKPPYDMTIKKKGIKMGNFSLAGVHIRTVTKFSLIFVFFTMIL